MRSYRIGIGTWMLSPLVAVGLLGMASGSWGQGLPEPVGEQSRAASAPTPRTFGTVSDVAYTVPSPDFQLGGGTELGGVFNNLSRNCVVGFMPGNFCAWLAGVRLPSGARVNRIQLDGCDTSATTELVFDLSAKPRSNVGGNLLASGSTGVGDTPGCALFDEALPVPATIDNADNLYVVRVIAQPDAQKTVFAGMRIFYTLQVSPAPAAATFGDVPLGHPQHQYIEALVASGITAGCGGGNYCPDAPLTRGQMAVFLSKGLGLHFVP